MASLRSLDPRLRPWAEYMLQVANANAPYFGGSSMVVTSARRSRMKQAQLYDRYIRGLSKIPAAPPGRSIHEYGLAWDMARLGVDPLRDELLVALGHYWQELGGHWGGTRDPVHFQAPL